MWILMLKNSGVLSPSDIYILEKISLTIHVSVSVQSAGEL